MAHFGSLFLWLPSPTALDAVQEAATPCPNDNHTECRAA
jgi:hypothetical protein